MTVSRIILISLAACSLSTMHAETPQDLSGADEVLPLEAAIDQALAHNLGLVISRYAPANAADDVVVEESTFDPQLFGSVSTRESQSAASSSALDSASRPESETRRAAVGIDKRLSTGATVTVDTNLNRSSSNNNAVRNPDYSSDVGISIRQPLLKDAWTKVNLAALMRSKVSLDQSIFQLRSDVLDVITDTEIAYWNLAYARAQRALIGSSIELAKNLLDENRERERLGLVTPLEVLQSETEFVNQQEDIIQADRAIADAEDVLRRTMGNYSFLDALDDELLVQGLPTRLTALRSMDLVVRDTIASDTDAKIQEKTIELQRIDRLLAQDESRPDLDLTAGVDYQGRDEAGEEAYRGAYNADGYNWSVGMELRFPWGFRSAKARERQAERNVERAEVQLYDIKQQKALAARNAWRAVDSGMQRIEVTRQALVLNEESFKQARARYGSGLVAYRLVLEAQRDFDQARINYLSSIIDTLRANVRLSRVDSTILERNGFSWETLSDLETAPDLEAHPLADKLTHSDM